MTKQGEEIALGMGSASGTIDLYVKTTPTTVQRKVDKTDLAETNDRSMAVSQVIRTSTEYGDGEVPAILRSSNLIVMMRNFLGQDKATPTTADGVHTYNFTNGVPFRAKNLYLYFRDVAGALIQQRGTFSALTIDIPSDNAITFSTATWLGVGSTEDATTTFAPSFVKEQPYSPANSSIKITKVGGTEKTLSVDSGSIEMTNNVTGKTVVGGRIISGGALGVTLNLTQTKATEEYFDSYNSDDVFTATIEIAGASGKSAGHGATITLSGLQIGTGYTENRTLGEDNTETIPLVLTSDGVLTGNEVSVSVASIVNAI